MTKERSSGLDPVTHFVTNLELIPSRRYYDPEFFALERERLWPYVWQMACRLEQIPTVGDYVEYSILGKSLIVVRTKNGVKAFHNACRHRGMQLVTTPGNCARRGLTCRFHGWNYNMDGENKFVFGKHMFSPEVLASAEVNLKPCRVELWAGCAFINFDDRAPSLLESLGPVVERMNARHVDKLKMDWWYATTLPVNWKLAMEAFMESYHVMRTHPQLFTAAAATGGSYGPDARGKLLHDNLDARQTINSTIDGLAKVSAGMAGLIHHNEMRVIQRRISVKGRGVHVPEFLPAALLFGHVVVSYSAADAGILPVRNLVARVAPGERSLRYTQATDCAPLRFEGISGDSAAGLCEPAAAAAGPACGGLRLHAVVKQRRRHDQQLPAADRRIPGGS